MFTNNLGKYNKDKHMKQLRMSMVERERATPKHPKAMIIPISFFADCQARLGVWNARAGFRPRGWTLITYMAKISGCTTEYVLQTCVSCNISTGGSGTSELQ